MSKKKIEETVMLCMSEGLKAFKQGDYITAAKFWNEPLNLLIDYRKLKHEDLVIVTPIKDKKKKG